MKDYEYKRKGNIIEIIIRDNYQKIEQFKINMADKKQFKKVISYIEFKYGLIEPEISHDESINNKDKNWLDMDNDLFK